MTQVAIADVAAQTVVFDNVTYQIQPLAADTFTVLVAAVPVGRIVYAFGAANGVPNADSDVSEDVLNQVAEAWFAAAE